MCSAAMLLNELLKDCACNERDKQYDVQFQKKVMEDKRKAGVDVTKEKAFVVKQHDVKGSLVKLIEYYDNTIKLNEDVVKETFIKGGLYPYENKVTADGNRIPLFLQFVKSAHVDKVNLPVFRQLAKLTLRDW